MTNALKHLAHLLTISLTDGDGAGGGESGGGSGEPAVEPAATETPAVEGEKPADKPVVEDPVGVPKAKPAAEVKPDAKATEAAAKASAELAKTYETWKPTLPKDMPFDEKGFGDYRKLFAESGLKPEQAQKFVDAFANAELGRLKEVAAGIQKEHAQWQTTLKADKELAGADGKQLDATMRTARTAMQKWATPEFRKLLDDSKLSRHPEMIRLLARAGKGLAEDSTKDTKPQTVGKALTGKAANKVRYPNSPELHQD